MSDKPQLTPDTPVTPCAFCKQKDAHPKSEEGFCYKCHFEIFDVDLEADEDGDDSEDMRFNDDWD